MNYQDELEVLQDLAFQPTVHQLYEDELFPELEFSRKHSEISCVAEPHEDEHDSSFEMPKLPESDDSDAGDLSGMNGRGRRRHHSRRSDVGSHGGLGAVS